MNRRLALLVIPSVAACRGSGDNSAVDLTTVRLGQTVYPARCANCHGAR